MLLVRVIACNAEIESNGSPGLVIGVCSDIDH